MFWWCRKCNCIRAVKAECLLVWSLSHSHTPPTRVTSSEWVNVGNFGKKLHSNWKSQNKIEDFYQPNRGADYSSHSSAQTSKPVRISLNANPCSQWQCPLVDSTALTSNTAKTTAMWVLASADLTESSLKSHWQTNIYFLSWVNLPSAVPRACYSWCWWC